jgi:hypothetical protein
MYAYVVVVPTPFRTTVDRRGNFRIDGVPSGPYRVRVWHRRESELTPTLLVGEGEALQLTANLSSGQLTVRGRE